MAAYIGFKEFPKKVTTKDGKRVIVRTKEEEGALYAAQAEKAPKAPKPLKGAPQAAPEAQAEKATETTEAGPLAPNEMDA